MKVEWLPVAERNRDSQLLYIAEHNPSAAMAAGDAIMTAAVRLGAHPHSGRPGRVAGTRELVIAGTPFIMAYRVEAEAVVILRLLHGAQRWPERAI